MYAYAYVQKGVVLDIEKRTLGDTSDHPIGKYYHGALQPFFIPIKPGENAPADQEVARGWAYSDNQFSEPQPFSINPETGELYLPPKIPAEQFWQMLTDNIQLQEALAQTQAVANQLLLDQLTAEGAIV